MARKMLAFLFCPLITCFWVIPSLSVALSTAASSAHASSSCSSDFEVMFPKNKAFASCIDLPILDSFLYWNYNPSSTTLHIAYRHTHVTSSTWVAWGINPTSKGMVGTQAVVAYQNPDRTVAVFTSSVDSYGTRLRKGNLSLPVSGLSASFSKNQMVIFAVFRLPENTTSVNHVWQDGPISGNGLGMHQVSGNHLQPMATLNLSSGQASASHGGSSKKTQLKITHGVLNTVSWGIIMPLRFMVAMYLKAVEPKTDRLWSNIHITLQLSGYLLGMAGSATGLYLHILSSGIHYPCRMGIGIALFCLGLFQVSALFFRPAKDHKYIYLWNWFHHLMGYTVLLLSFANIWICFYILKPAKAWVIAYGVVSGAIIVTTIIFEIWKVLTRDGKVNGANGEEIKV